MQKPRSTLGWVARALVALVCLVPSAPVYAQGSPSGKVDEAVREAVRSGQAVRAIVRFRNDDDRQRGGNLVAARGGRVRKSHNDVRALTVDIDPNTVHALDTDDGVLGISIDARVRSSAEGDQRRSARSSGAKKARDQYNRSGRGIAIAVIDSGVQPHADLPAARIRAFVDFVNGRSAPYDDFGHGTHVAGIAAGSGASSASQEDPFVGAAPEISIVALKVLDATGAGSTSDVIAALEWVAANHQAYNIKVVNLSLGHPVYEPPATDPLVLAANALVRRGIVVVASSGNTGINPATGLPGYGGVLSPANSAEVIAVGAVDNKGSENRSDDGVTDYSGRGPSRFEMIVKPNLVASGHRVVSLSAPGSFLFQNYPNLHVFGGSESVARYMVLSGTSMAAPTVAGAAALVMETNSRLSAHAVRTILEFTAQHLPGTDLMTQGAGYLNTFGAVRLAGLIKPNAPVGAIWLRRHTIPVAQDELFGEQVAWNKTVLWGPRVLLGDSAYVHFRAWNDNVVWGQDDNVVWGQDEDDNVVWGQQQCDDDNCDNVVWGQDDLDNVVWGQCSDAGCDNVVWGQDEDNVVWGQCGDNCDNVVWGQCDKDCDNVVWGQNSYVLGYWASQLVAGFWSPTVDWTHVKHLVDSDNVVWGQDGEGDNVVWGQDGDNVVWGQCDENGCSNVVWGQNGDNVVWGQDGDNVVWGQDGDNVVWGQTLGVLTMEGGA